MSVVIILLLPIPMPVRGMAIIHGLIIVPVIMTYSTRRVTATLSRPTLLQEALS